MTCRFRPSRHLFVHFILIVFLALGAFVASAGPTHSQDQTPLLGFGPASSATQMETEADLASEINSANLEMWMERMTRAPFFVGAPWNYENAMFVADLYRSWGYNVEIAEYEVLFPTPTFRRVEMLSPESFTASLEDRLRGVNTRLRGVPGLFQMCLIHGRFTLSLLSGKHDPRFLFIGSPTVRHRLTYRLVTGMRRSFPRAFCVILIPIGDWRRLYSLRSTMAITRLTVCRGNPFSAIS